MRNLAFLGAVWTWVAAPASTLAVEGEAFSPTALAQSEDRTAVYVAGATANQIAVFDAVEQRVIRTIALSAPPTGLAVSPNGKWLVATLSSPHSEVWVIEGATGEVARRIRTGHTAMSPVLSSDGNTLFVCNRFDDDIAVIDLVSAREVRRIAVRREPVAAALTADGRHLLVANHLHDGRADRDDAAAVVSVISVANGVVVKELRLPSGSGLLNDLRVSPDGRYAFVTHVLARFQLPTTQLERGWMNTNAGTLIDLETLSIVNTVLLDSVDSGAANPWGIGWTADGRTLAVAHAGTHEISLIDFPGLLAKLARFDPSTDPSTRPQPTEASQVAADVPNDLSFLVGLRRRVPLPKSDRGPRALVVMKDRVLAANYFSDTLSLLSVSEPVPVIESAPLRPTATVSMVRQGEAWFHDATLCFQGWQSCASCHPGDARVDALNWDLLNDDIGNPKNNKSLLLSHRTPPAMSLGVRDTAETAVRAGIRHILFTVQPEGVATAMDEYLKALQPVPSPHLVDGGLSAAARRGQEVFGRPEVGCADCHPPGLFTDLRHHNVGTRSPLDPAEVRFDTPTLIEIWRTAPYLHDGSVTSLMELLTTRNPDDRHGRTSQLKAPDLDDLVAYLLSL